MQTQLLCFQMKAGDPTRAAASDKVAGRFADSSKLHQQPSFPLALHRETEDTMPASRSASPEVAPQALSQLAGAGESGQIFATAIDEVEHVLPLQSGGSESEKAPVHEKIIAAVAEEIAVTDSETAEGGDARPGAIASPMTADLKFVGTTPGETLSASASAGRQEMLDANGFFAAKGQIAAGRSAATGQTALSSAPEAAGSDATPFTHPTPDAADSVESELKDSLRNSQTGTARHAQKTGPNPGASDTGGLPQAPVQPPSKHFNGAGEAVSRTMENSRTAGERTVDGKEGLSAETKSSIDKGSTPSGNAADIARSSAEPMPSESLDKPPERIATDLGPRQGTFAAGDNRLSVAAADLQAAAEEAVRTAKTNPGDMIDQIVKKAVIRLKDGISEARIDLKPELLGHLRLSISTDNQQVTLRILTENPLVKEIIESSAAQLKADLSNQGLQMEQLEVGVNGDRDRLGHQSNTPGQAAGQMREKTSDAAADADRSAENEASTAPASESGKEIDTFV